MVPTFSAGQSVCTGCGSEAMLCDLVSLLTKVTACPTLTVTLLFVTPLAAIVIVAPTGGAPLPLGVGEVGELPPPHATAIAATVEITAPPKSLLNTVSSGRAEALR